MKLATGVGNGVFQPDRSITRAEAAVLLARLTGLDGGNEAADFPDTKNHWARREIALARYYNLVMGDDNGLFRPDSFITREEFAVMAERCVLLPDTADFNQSFFDDVSPEENTWSNRAIVKLSLAGILAGREARKFHPGADISRAEAAKIIRLLYDLPRISKSNISTFTEPLPVQPR